MTGPPLPEPLDPESTEPVDPWADWVDEDPDDGDERPVWEPWDDEDWWGQDGVLDDDGTAEASRWHPVRTIAVAGGVL